MKKTRILALVLCVSVMLMGAGYAYWTDTLTINSTVSTGELNVDFTGCSLESNDTGEYFTVVDENDESGELDNVVFALNNLYPGASATLNLRMENTGTIPAVLHRLNVVFNNEGMPNDKTLLSDADIAKIEIVDGTVGVKIGTFSRTATIAQIKSALGLTSINLTHLTTLMNFFEPDHTLRLEPGDYIDLSGLVIELNGPGTDESAENSFVHMGITMDFGQHNTTLD